MLNFKKEYFKLEENRQQYATSFSDLMTNCEVYGKKQNPITSTAFIFLIPKDYYTYNAGNIDFTNYPDGIWNDYTDIKIVKSEPYFDLDFVFSSIGDITPENLNQQFKKIKDYFLETQKEIVEKQAFLDSGIPEQLGLPKLPIGCIWYQDTDGLVALPVSKYYSMFDELIKALRKIIRELLEDDFEELEKKAFENLEKKTEGLIQELQKNADRLLLIAEHKHWKANTIEDLKHMQFLHNGDVVEVLGYYETGDGANHKRKIEIENDGSGVQLDNRLWANIVKNSYGVNKDDIEDLKKSKLNKAESEIDDTDKNVVNAINKALGNSNANMQEIEKLKNKKISEQDIQDNSIPAYKFKTSSDLDKIKLINLSEEVINAMTGKTPVSPTVEDNSITTNKIADNAVAVRKIEDINIGNYFNKDSPENVDGSYLSGGVPQSNISYSYSHKIQVQPNDLIRNNLFSEIKGGSCYTINDVFVADLVREGEKKYRVPNNKTISYVRVNYHTADEPNTIISINRELDNKYYKYNEIIFGEKFNSSIDNEMIKDNSVTQKKIKSYSLSGSTNIKYINVFNKNDITSGIYVDFSGNIQNASTYFLTNFIPVKSLDRIYMPQFGEATGGYCYDEKSNKIGVLKRISYEEASGRKQIKGLYEVPDNTKIAKVRLNGLLKHIDQHTCYLNYISDEYAKYGYKEIMPNVDLENKIDVADLENKINTATNILYGKKIVLTGDSICYGAGFKGGYGKIIVDRNNMKYQNIAVGGGTITAEQYTSSGTKRFWICRSIENLDTDADYVLLEGGVNDGSLAVPLGTITDRYDKSFDDTTYCGAFESMCKQTLERFSGKKIGFVIVHKMTAGYTKNYYEITIEMLKKWGIPYIDLHSDCPPLNYIPSLKAKYTKDSDGWHPNEEGYKKYYVDKIESFLRRL